jgi:hypothetical protein
MNKNGCLLRIKRARRCVRQCYLPSIVLFGANGYAYLAYGSLVPTQLAGFVDDLLIVLKAFAAMAGAFCSMRVGKIGCDARHEYSRYKGAAGSNQDVSAETPLRADLESELAQHSPR